MKVRSLLISLLVAGACFVLPHHIFAADTVADTTASPEKAVLMHDDVVGVPEHTEDSATDTHAVAEEHGSDGHAEGGHGAIGAMLLMIAVVIMAAKLAGGVEKFGMPAVLGELLVGVLLGNLALVGITWFEGYNTNELLPFLAELGVIILLFQVGLESNINEMKKVGTKALLVAIVGVVLPFLLGTYLVGPYLLPGYSQVTYLFLGAALTATSVGITARVFKDLGKLRTKEAQIVLGAAVIDDVLGLVILAVVSALASTGEVSALSVAVIVGKSFGFLAAAIFLGRMLAPILGNFFSKVQNGSGMKLSFAISAALIMAYLAGEIGLAPIVGAFAAGLILDPVHFSRFRNSAVTDKMKELVASMKGKSKRDLDELIHVSSHQHIEDLVEPLGHFFIPIFFVLTGMNVNLEVLFQPVILLTGLAITLVAVVGKYSSGFLAGPVKKAVVGMGMVPRGEVGLIFATIGQSLGVFDDELFSIIVVMVIMTTLLTPPILMKLLKRP